MPDLPDRWSNLTEPELHVALGIAIGKRNPELAAEREISTKTIDTHRAHVLAKLKLGNNVDLARDAIAMGVVTICGHSFPKLTAIAGSAAKLLEKLERIGTDDNRISAELRELRAALVASIETGPVIGQAA
jgi:DNA-binding CsgD family transcriptional regulator